MDQGGLPIYNGIPMNAIVHFKSHTFKGNAHERECSLCGNVNPEQIFNLIDAKIVDEFGNEIIPDEDRDQEQFYDESEDFTECSHLFSRLQLEFKRVS